MVQADTMLEHTSVGRRSGLDRKSEGRRVLDLAQGILMANRRYPSEAAFEELVAVAHRHDVAVSAVASALVALAAGPAERAETPRLALAIANLAWADLFPGSDGRALGQVGVGESAV